MRQNFRNQRHQALEFLAKRGSKGEEQFLPYTKERNGMGKLPIMNSDSRLVDDTISIPRHRQKVSLIVPPSASQKVVLIKKNLIHFFAHAEVKSTSRNFVPHSKINDTNNSTLRQRTKQTENYQDELQDTIQLEGLSIEGKMQKEKARRYKQFMKLKAYTELHQNFDDELRAKSIDIDKITPEARAYRWKMNQVEKKQFLENIKTKKKLNRDTKQIYKQLPIELPGIGHYQPNWDQVHPKSTFNILIAKPKHQEITETQTITPLQTELKTTYQTISASQSSQFEINQQNEVVQMYNHLQNQVKREVQHSIKLSPQVRHPYENMTMKPLHPGFVDKFKNELQDKMQISQKLQLKIKQRLKDFDTNIEP